MTDTKGISRLGIVNYNIEISVNNNYIGTYTVIKTIKKKHVPTSDSNIETWR